MPLYTPSSLCTLPCPTPPCTSALLHVPFWSPPHPSVSLYSHSIPLHAPLHLSVPHTTMHLCTTPCPILIPSTSLSVPLQPTPYLYMPLYTFLYPTPCSSMPTTSPYPFVAHCSFTFLLCPLMPQCPCAHSWPHLCPSTPFAFPPQPQPICTALCPSMPLHIPMSPSAPLWSLSASLPLCIPPCLPALPCSLCPNVNSAT